MTVYVVTKTDVWDDTTFVDGVYSKMKTAEERKRKLDELTGIVANVESFEVE